MTGTHKIGLPSGTHGCGHPDCRRQIERDLFACWFHWSRLPRPIRNTINAAFATYRRDRVAGAAGLLAAHQLAFDHWDAKQAEVVEP